MKFIAPLQQEITAAIAPLPREVRVPAAAPIGKGAEGKAPEVKSWRYQLSGVDPEAVANSAADLVVIDYAGSNGPFTRAEVDQMRRKPDGSRRLVLAYMSIGQAETYRWYWPQRSPAGSAPRASGTTACVFGIPDWQTDHLRVHRQDRRRRLRRRLS